MLSVSNVIALQLIKMGTFGMTKSAHASSFKAAIGNGATSKNNLNSLCSNEVESFIAEKFTFRIFSV